jgi:small subunit ribosomal protein S9
MSSNTNTFYAIGRRKQAIAQVTIEAGSGKLTINERTPEDYLQNNLTYLTKVKKPLDTLNVLENYNIQIRSKGGGLSGQVDSITLAISRALTLVNPENRSVLKAQKLLTRDPRVKERKKYGLKKARKASQFSKR